MFMVFVLSFMMLHPVSILASAFNALGKAGAEKAALKQIDKAIADHQGEIEIITRHGIKADRVVLDRAEQKLKELEKSDEGLLCMLIQAAYYPDVFFHDPHLQENLQKQLTISAEFSVSVGKNMTIAFSENYRKLIKSLYLAQLESQKK